MMAAKRLWVMAVENKNKKSAARNLSVYKLRKIRKSQEFQVINKTPS
jgi:hypothetical protein